MKHKNKIQMTPVWRKMIAFVLVFALALSTAAAGIDITFANESANFYEVESGSGYDDNADHEADNDKSDNDTDVKNDTETNETGNEVDNDESDNDTYTENDAETDGADNEETNDANNDIEENDTSDVENDNDTENEESVITAPEAPAGTTPPPGGALAILPNHPAAQVITFVFPEDMLGEAVYFATAGSSFELLNGVTALTEFEVYVDVFVISDGGFDIDAEFPYNVFTVIYGAVHPVSEVVHIREREIVVVQGISPVASGTLGVGGAPWTFNSNILRIYPGDINVAAPSAPSDGSFQPHPSPLAVALLESAGVSANSIGTIEFVGPVVANANSSFLFSGMSHLMDIRNAHFLDVSNVTDMRGMFLGAMGLYEDLAISNWDTSNVTNMANMFTSVVHLGLLVDLSNWDTSSVTDMTGLFAFVSLGAPNISNWNTSNVTLMNGMFSFVPLNSLNTSNWNTRNMLEGGMNQLFGNMGPLGLREIILGKDFVFSGDIIGILNAPNNTIYNGHWTNVGTGTVLNPQSNYAFPTGRLLELHHDATQTTDTWIWQRRDSLPVYELEVTSPLTLRVTDSHAPYFANTITIEAFEDMLNASGYNVAENTAITIPFTLNINTSDFNAIDFTQITRTNHATPLELTAPFEVAVTAVWATGQTDTQTVHVHIVDQTAPVIDVPQAEYIFYTNQTPPTTSLELLTRANVTVLDNYDGIITPTITFPGAGIFSLSDIDWTLPASHDVYVNAVDFSDNAATQEIFTIVIRQFLGDYELRVASPPALQVNDNYAPYFVNPITIAQFQTMLNATGFDVTANAPTTTPFELSINTADFAAIGFDTITRTNHPTPIILTAPFPVQVTATWDTGETDTQTVLVHIVDFDAPVITSASDELTF